MERGTNVGRAYVKGVFDGSGMNEDIVDSVDGAGDDLDKKGSEQGESYGEHFGEGMSESMTKARGDLSRAFAESWDRDAAMGGDQAGTTAGERITNSLREKLSNSSGDVDKGVSDMLGGSHNDAALRKFADHLSEVIGDRLELDLSSVLGDIEDQIAEATKGRGGGGGGVGGGSGSGSGSSRLYPTRDPDEALRLRAIQFDIARTRRIGAMQEAAIRMNEARDRSFGVLQQRALAMNDARDRAISVAHGQALRMNDTYDQALGRMQEAAIKMNKARDLDIFRKEEARIRTLGVMQTAALRMNGLFDKGKLGTDGRSVSGNSGGDDKSIGGKIGSLLGEGSRNNFLNATGKSVGKIINLFESLFKSGGKVFTEFSKGFNSLEESASLGQKTMAGFGGALTSAGSSLASLGASLPILAIGLGVVIAAASVLASVLSALTAIAVALVSTIASALVAALVVGGAGLAAMAGAAGLLVVAFTSLTDAQKKLFKDGFAPLKAELTGIGQLIVKQFTEPIYGGNSAITVWSNNLQKALLLAAPAAQATGRAFAEAGNALTAAFSGPGFQQFANALAVYLPGIIRNLSTALGGFLNGLLSIFSVAMPYVLEFARNLNVVANRFQKWAASADGQNSISDFVRRAVDSLKSLSRAVRQVFGFISDVLFNSSSQTAGNQIFDGITRAFGRFRQAISDGSLERWFSQAISFGHQLYDAMGSVGRVFAALSNSGTLTAVGFGLQIIAGQLSLVVSAAQALGNVFSYGLPVGLATGVFALKTVGDTIIAIADAAKFAGSVLNSILPGDPFGTSDMNFDQVKESFSNIGDNFTNYIAALNPNQMTQSNSSGPRIFGPAIPPGAPMIDFNSPQFNMPGLINSGNSALDQTSIKNGGNRPDYVNPYQGYADSLIKSGPSISAQIKNALLTINKQINTALISAANASNASTVKQAMANTINSIRTNAKEAINTARDALTSAAQNLSSSTSATATTKALRQVAQAQRDLAAAYRNQDKINRVAQRLAAQKIVTNSNVVNLLNGYKVQNATLADYATARERLAKKLVKANKALAAATTLRNDYKKSVVDATKTYGSLLTAQAQTIDGVEQALTYTDITSNLQTRLDKIRTFQDDLRKLLALGLNADSYKQLVDGGVEAGSAYASALVSGGTTAISQVNDLTSQISAAANGLGGQASNRLYQAGVDAAQGLVDGLESLSGKLDSAAARLGKSIARAIKEALGIHSPSRVMRDMMGYVGDGVVHGLNDQHAKVESASNRLAQNISITPSLSARYLDRKNGSAVSGNQTIHQWNITTPTQDPEAVAREMMNEMTGRIG